VTKKDGDYFSRHLGSTFLIGLSGFSRLSFCDSARYLRLKMQLQLIDNGIADARNEGRS
jgi:hypothetical protein